MRLLKGSVGCFLGLLVGAAWLGCAGRSLSPAPTDPKPMDRPPYVIGVTDVLQIVVWKNEESPKRATARSGSSWARDPERGAQPGPGVGVFTTWPRCLLAFPKILF